MAKKRGLLGKITGFGTGFVDGMKKRDKDRDYLLDNGLDGTATMLKSGGPLKTKEESGASAQAYGDDERRIYTLRIDVADGREPYELTGNFFIPNFFKGRDWIRGIEEGATLPVKVGKDNPDEVAIDWDAFEAGGAKEQVEQTRAIRYASKEAEHREQLGVEPPPAEAPPPLNASPRETLDWQLRNGVLDQATYDAILANNPKL